MSSLNREAILAADDRPVEQVDVPEWGGAVNVRALSGEQRGKIEQLAYDIQQDKASVADMYVQLALWSVVDGAGERLFDASDHDALAQKSGTALEKIGLRAMRISGLSADAIELEAKN